MEDFPIFLLPKGEIMMTAKVEGSDIKLLKKTLFPSGNRYAISKLGLAACIDKEKKIIIYGQINYDGDFEYIKILPFPSIISPEFICVINSNIILAAGYPFSSYYEKYPKDIIVSYSITTDSFSTVNLPYSGFINWVEAFLLYENKLIAIYNQVNDEQIVNGEVSIKAIINQELEKYCVEYDFSNPENPRLLNFFHLQKHIGYSVTDGTSDNDYIALLSYKMNTGNDEQTISIFQKGNYNTIITLNQFLSNPFDENDTKKDFPWNDIFLVPNKNLLLVASNEGGIGICHIDFNRIEWNTTCISNSFHLLNGRIKKEKNPIYKDIYINIIKGWGGNEYPFPNDYGTIINDWEKKVIKILPVPNDPDRIIVIVENFIYEQVFYSYDIICLEIFFSYLRDNDIEDSYFINKYFPGYLEYKDWDET